MFKEECPKKKLIFLSRKSNPDLRNLFTIKRRFSSETVLFPDERGGKFFFPIAEKTGLAGSLAPGQLWRAWRLARAVRRERIGTVVFDNADPINILIGLLLKPYRVRLCYTIHDQQPHDNNTLVRVYNWLVGKMADEVIVFSSPEPGRWKKVRQFRLGAYQGEYAPVRTGRSFGRNPRTALFFGRVEKYKGYENLAPIAKRLAGRNIRLVVAGRGDSEHLEAARDLPNVEVINRFIPEEEVTELFNAAHVNLLPYREATQSGVLLLAASFGVPSIAFAVGQLEEYMVGGVGKCVPAGDLDAFADAALEYLEMDEQSWQQARKACLRSYKALYSEEKFLAQYEGLIEEYTQ